MPTWKSICGLHNLKKEGGNVSIARALTGEYHGNSNELEVSHENENFYKLRA
jgi:hypothetical protein